MALPLCIHPISGAASRGYLQCVRSYDMLCLQRASLLLMSLTVALLTFKCTQCYAKAQFKGSVCHRDTLHIP
jgi:hypothetical protein